MGTIIILPLGNGSCWDNNELRFALRSLEKYLTGYDEIFVVGDNLPDWLQGVTRINVGDRTEFRSMNTLIKIIEVLKVTNAEKFLLWYDDIYLNRNFNANAFPNYYKGDILKNFKKINDESVYKQSKMLTHNILFRHGYQTKSFEVHCPFLFKVSAFQNMLTLYPNRAPGYLYKSLYANMMKVHPTFHRQIMLHEPLSLEQITGKLQGQPFYSIRDRALNEDLKTWFVQEFPRPGIFESVDFQ